jgi:Alkylmercury lyase
MLFFRSEEDLEQWKRERNITEGQVVSVGKIWELSQVWYGNRLERDFHGRSLEEAEGIFRGVGLTSGFWYRDGKS